MLEKFGPDFPDKTIYLIDFGLSKFYIENGRHIPMKTDARFVGTARYSSIGSHSGITQSRRDDLEGIFFVLMYYLRGDLPWQGLKGKDKKENKKRMAKMKENYSIYELTKGFPFEFVEIFLYIRSLKYSEQPDYELIINMMNSMATKHNIKYDYNWDWNIMFRSMKQSAQKKQFRKLYKVYPNAKFTNFLKALERPPEDELVFFNKELDYEGAPNNATCKDINFLFMKKRNALQDCE